MPFTRYTTSVLSEESVLCSCCKEIQVTRAVYAGGDSNPANRLRVICDPCDDRLEREFQHWGLLARLRGLNAEGVVSEATATSPYCHFDGGDPEKEKPNAGNWDKLRSIHSITYDNYFFSGPVGTGKSTAARCLLTRALSEGTGVREVTARTLCKEWARFEEPNMRLWERVRLLLIDDVDKGEWSTHGALQGFWELMEWRASNGRRTIMTTNLTKKELLGMLKTHCQGNTSLVSAIFDRLNPCLSLEFTGASMRRAETGGNDDE